MSIHDILRLKQVNKEVNGVAEGLGLRLLHEGLSETERGIFLREHEEMRAKLTRDKELHALFRNIYNKRYLHVNMPEDSIEINGIFASFILRAALELNLKACTIFVAWHYIAYVLSRNIPDIDDAEYFGLLSVMSSIEKTAENVCLVEVMQKLESLIPDYDECVYYGATRISIPIIVNIAMEVPTLNDFVKIFRRAANLEEDAELYELMCLLGLMDERIRVNCCASMLAAAAAMCARKVTGEPEWTEILTAYTGYEADELHEPANVLLDSMLCLPADVRVLLDAKCPESVRLLVEFIK